MINEDLARVLSIFEDSKASLKENYGRMTTCLTTMKEIAVKMNDTILLEQVTKVLNNIVKTSKQVDSVLPDTIEAINAYVRKMNGNVEDLVYMTKRINNNLAQTIATLKNTQ